MTKQIFCFVALVASFPLAFAWLFWQAGRAGEPLYVNGYLQVDLKSLGFFPLDPVSGTSDDIPLKWRSLDTRRVVLTGFMWDPQGSSDVTGRFVLVYDPTRRADGPPLVQQFVYATVRDGGSVKFEVDMVRAFGTLHVGIQRDREGAIQSVYRLVVDRVEPCPTD